MHFLKALFSSNFIPHGYCMRWNSSVVWLHVTSDTIITLAYYIIPLALIYFVRRRRDLVFDWMFVSFGVFILACGTTHLMGIITLWNPLYNLDGAIKAVTAVASIVTAIWLVKLIPQALRLPSPEQLQAEIDRRAGAEAEIRKINSELEARVRERTAALDRQNQALQRVAYIASHDLREPLRMVGNFSELVAQRYGNRLDEEGRQFLGYAVNGARRMDELIRDLLDYTRTIHQTADVPLIETSPRKALDGAMAILRLEIEESQARIVCAAEYPRVLAEEAQLQQVFQNLISNGIKYRRKGVPPEIHVSVEQKADHCLFCVRDNGIGIESQYNDLIFEAFRRLHPDIPGSGVGLALCRSIVEAFGGRIWVESKPGEGSAFWFALQPAASLTAVSDPRFVAP
jgi:signal transduction histidine kinase